MKFILTLTLLFGFVFAPIAIGIGQCPPAEAFLKKKKKDAYSLNSQSRSGSVAADESYEMSFIAHEGLDYRLTTVLDEGSAGTLNYEIYELVVEKKKDGEKETFKRTKKVLATSGSEALEFTSDKSRKIFINVSISGGDKKKLACVGVLIETKRSERTGF
ncbi:hypothetical protein D3C87_36070 [compost metagenome]